MLISFVLSFHPSQERQRRAIADLLAGAERFVGTSDQEHFDECETIVTDILAHIRSTAKQLKVNPYPLYEVAVLTSIPAACA